MADIKLFNINGKVKEYQSGTVTLEKELQTVIENNMTAFFGVYPDMHTVDIGDFSTAGYTHLIRGFSQNSHLECTMAG